jgi:xanthine dehydrogenase accessory factor
MAAHKLAAGTTMDSVDLEVLQRCADWLDTGHRVLLVTVVRTWGSSPRPEGAMLAVRDDGVVVGSVSGGCIEDDIVDRTRREGLSATACETVTYGVSADEARRFGLPCGGSIQLVLEPLTRDSGVPALLAASQGQSRRAAPRSRYRPRNACAGECNRRTHLRRQAADDHSWPAFRMLVIGASQLSKYLAQIAVGLDYQVTICDPRVEYTDTWDVPGVTLVKTMPDDTVHAMKLDERCAVVALTHDPKLDDMALMEALKSPAFYGRVRFAQRCQAPPTLERIRFDRRRDRPLAWPDRHLHRQPDAARNRGLDPRGNHCGEER